MSDQQAGQVLSQQMSGQVGTELSMLVRQGVLLGACRVQHFEEGVDSHWSQQAAILADHLAAQRPAQSACEATQRCWKVPAGCVCCCFSKVQRWLQTGFIAEGSPSRLCSFAV